MTPLVSVIVPVYKTEKYLNKSVDSILAQTFKDYELILVDDGSPDSSGEICDRYAAEHDHISVIHKANAGLGMARNSGVEKATGRYVLFLDSDDYYDEKLLETLYSEADKTDADVCASGFVHVFTDGSQKPEPICDKAEVFEEDRIPHFLFNCIGSLPSEEYDSKYIVTACARLYKRSIFEKYGVRFYSEREYISEDMVFQVDYLKYAKKAMILPYTGYYYRVTQGSLSKIHRSDRFEQDVKVYKVLIEKLSQSYKEEDFKLYTDRMIISHSRFAIIQDVLFHDDIDRSYPLRKSIMNNINTPELCQVLKNYPIGKLPRMQAIFAGLTKRKCVSFLIMLVRAKMKIIGGNQSI